MSNSITLSHLKEVALSNKYGLMVVIAGFICNFMVFGIGFSYGVFQEFYNSSGGPLMDYSDSNIAMIGTVGTAITYIFGIFNQTLVTSLGPRITMLCGSVLMSSGLIFTSFCKKFYQFLIMQGIIFGIGSSILYLPPVVCAPPFFNKSRAIAIGVLFSGTGFGGLTIAPLSRFLISAVGWKWCLRILGLTNLSFTMIASILVVEPTNINLEGRRSIISLSHLKSSKVYFVLLGGMFQSAGYLIPLFYMSKYAKTLNFSNKSGALFIGVNNAINAVFKIIFGYAGDRWGRLNTIIICSTFSAATIFGLWLLDLRGTYISFVVLYGVFSGVIISLLPACLIEIVGLADYQAISGLLYFFRGIGNLLGAPLAGLMISGQGHTRRDYKFVIIYNGLLLTVSTILLACLRLHSLKMQKVDLFRALF